MTFAPSGPMLQILSQSRGNFSRSSSADRGEMGSAGVLWRRQQVRPRLQWGIPLFVLSATPLLYTHPKNPHTIVR